ncbi:MAG: phosphate acetyltransferase [Deltaproteobacteria bacterium]|nr:phosphate acetyltransferase [Deltaproteobacteria bacterium]
MSQSIYVTSANRGSGKTTLALGLVSALDAILGKVAYFKPIASPRSLDSAERLRESLGLAWQVTDMMPVTSAEVVESIANNTFDAVLDRIMEAYSTLSREADFVVIEGSDYTGAMSTFAFNINAEIAKNLGAPTLLVADAIDCFETSVVGKVRDPAAVDRMFRNIRMVTESLREQGADLLGVVINRATPQAADAIQELAKATLGEAGINLLGTLPRCSTLAHPTLAEVSDRTYALVSSGQTRLDVTIQGVIIGAMSLNSVLGRVTPGALVIVPGDRDDVIIGLASTYHSKALATPCGLVLTGALKPGINTRRLLQDISHGEMPILEVRTDTYETALRISELERGLDPAQPHRVDAMRGLLERFLNLAALAELAGGPTHRAGQTPKQFLYGVIEKARADRKHIVLPEGTEERILRAASALLVRGVVDLTLLGDEDEIARKRDALGLRMEGARLINPKTHPWRERFAREYQRLRAHKNPLFDHAWDLMGESTYFGTMMVQMGHADGLVSGAVHTTADTLRPALEFVKTSPGYSIASSVFFMCLPDQVLVYGDCAVNPNPTAPQLADIALASAHTAAAFGIDPKVAMLSYSTGASGHGDDVNDVREATRLFRERSSIPVEGPIQYDAAIDADVAHTKLPHSEVAGKANIFIFPDLDAGNTTYKAVQRAAKAIAVGPVMQGLRKPVNDLSRGCSVADIINTVAITAVQAQQAQAAKES